MGRITRKNHNNLFGSRCDNKPGIKYFHASDFKNLRTTNFSFKNKNGFTLKGYYYYYDPIDFNTLVVFCHGMGGGHEAYMKEIEFLAHKGFTVLGFDYQGTILSEGDKTNGFLQGLSDLDECLTIIKKKHTFKNVYLVGHSWGAFNAMCVLKYHPEVSKVVALSGFISLKQIFRDSIPSPVKFLYRGLKKIEEKDNPKYKDISAVEVLSNYKGKALIYHSIDDNIVDYYNSFLVLKESLKNDNFNFVECSGKLHNVTYTIDAVTSLNKYLRELNRIENDEEKNTLANKTNFNKLCDLDFGLMNEIVTFLKN